MFYMWPPIWLCYRDVDTDVIKKMFSITDTATGHVYNWDISPYRMPTTEEFASRVAEIIEDICQ